jgi:hypothetical protein
MIAICRSKSSGKISRVVELTNTKFIQEQLTSLGLNNGDYYIDYFIGDIERYETDNNS